MNWPQKTRLVFPHLKNSFRETKTRLEKQMNQPWWRWYNSYYDSYVLLYLWCRGSASPWSSPSSHGLEPVLSDITLFPSMIRAWLNDHHYNILHHQITRRPYIHLFVGSILFKWFLTQWMKVVVHSIDPSKRHQSPYIQTLSHLSTSLNLQSSIRKHLCNSVGTFSSRFKFVGTWNLDQYFSTNRVVEFQSLSILSS